MTMKTRQLKTYGMHQKQFYAFQQIVSACQEIILGLSVPTRELEVCIAYGSSQGLNLGLACVGRGAVDGHW